VIKQICALSSKLNKNLNLPPYPLYFKCLIITACLFFSVLTNSAEITNNIVEKPVLDIFVRDGCPHCTEAKKFLPS
jgi:hypothetical protein